jgi:hypothetical protein
MLQAKQDEKVREYRGWPCEAGQQGEWVEEVAEDM